MKNHPYLNPKKDYSKLLQKSTLIESFEKACEIYSSQKTCGKRISIINKKNDGKSIIKDQILYVTYHDILSKSQKVANSLYNVLNHEIDVLEKIGLYANCDIDWSYFFYGCLYNRYCVVGIPPDTKIEGLVLMLNDSKINTIILGKEQYKLFKDYSYELSKRLKFLKRIILINEDMKKSDNVKFEKIEIVECSELLKRKEKVEFQGFKIQDPILMVFSSGTTGTQKPMVMTNYNIIHGFNLMIDVMKICKDDVYISLIPTTHMYGLCSFAATFYQGGKIMYGTPTSLFSKPNFVGDVDLAQVTFFVTVPLILETLHKLVYTQLRRLKIEKEFDDLLQKKIDSMKNGEELEHKEEEERIFTCVRKFFGNNLRFAVCAAAALNPNTHAFFRATLGKGKFIQAYGASEISGPGAFQTFEDFKPGCTGFVMMPVTKNKIIDIPEMGYFVKNNQGELCFFGPTVVSGYIGKPEVNKNTFVNGWYRTGDVVTINSDGTISVIDRKRNIIKLSNGRNISLANLEMMYEESPFIKANGMCIFTNPSKPFIVSVIMVDEKYSLDWSEKKNIKTDTIDDLIKNEKYYRAVLDSLNGIRKAKRLKPYEKIEKIALFNNEFSPADGTTTGARKKIRRKIYSLYKETVQKLFSLSIDSKFYLTHLESIKEEDSECQVEVINTTTTIHIKKNYIFIGKSISPTLQLEFTFNEKQYIIIIKDQDQRIIDIHLENILVDSNSIPFHKNSYICDVLHSDDIFFKTKNEKLLKVVI